MKAEELEQAVTDSSGGGILIACHIQPRASRTSIKGLHGGRLKISLASPPVDGKANSELIKFLSKNLGTSKSSIDIISGLQSRQKNVRVKGITKKSAIDKLVG